MEKKMKDNTIKVAKLNGTVKECFNARPFLFNTYLVEQDLAETRVQNIGKAVDDLHKALCACDLENRAKFFKNFPTVQRLLNTFGTEEEVTNNF
tara:strand:- start:1098 stop:1379 length:282 start_codon:yes stop_codon:yes gene_type:complete